MIDSYIFFENLKITNDDKLNEIYKDMSKSLKNVKNGKLEVCKYIRQVYDHFQAHKNEIYLELTYGKTGGQVSTYTFVGFCKGMFGFAPSTSYSYLNVYNKFLDPEVVEEKWVETFSKFDASKLIELLTVDMEQLKKDIPVNLIWLDSRDLIRKYVKSLAGETSQKPRKNLEKEKKEDEKADFNDLKIPKDYNFQEAHTSVYFEQFKQEELIQLILAYERLYHKTKGVK